MKFQVGDKFKPAPGVADGKVSWITRIEGDRVWFSSDGQSWEGSMNYLIKQINCRNFFHIKDDKFEEHKKRMLNAS